MRRAYGQCGILLKGGLAIECSRNNAEIGHDDEIRQSLDVV